MRGAFSEETCDTQRMAALQSARVTHLFLWVCGLLAGCGADVAPMSTVNIDVRTGLVAGAEFASVRLEVFDSVDGETAHNLLRSLESPAVFGDDFPTGVRAAALELPPGEYRIRVQLLRSDRRLLVGFTRLLSIDADEIRFETFVLSRDCVGEAICPVAGASAALSECLAGQCVDPRCEPPNPEFCGGLVFCNDDAECTPAAECAESSCIDGLCTPRSLPGACGAEEYCNPSTGCADLDERMTEIPCGEFCEMGCVAGIWSCTPEGSTCEMVGFKDEGIACGDAGACDGAGTCVEP